MDNFHCAHAHEAAENIPDDIICADLSDFFKIFGDTTRIKVLFAIQQKELCVHDLSILLNMHQSAISHQLKTLRQYKLVKVRRDGKSNFYSLDDEHINSILIQGLEHINHKNAKKGGRI